MNHSNSISTNSTAHRLESLAQLYQHGQSSELIDRTLDKLLAYEADVSRTQLHQLLADLGEFEQRFGISSEEFYARYNGGQTDDRMDYVEWASLVQMRDNLEKRLRLLARENPQ